MEGTKLPADLASVYGELKSRNNSKSVAMPRQVAMYLCKALTHASLPEIGRRFAAGEEQALAWADSA